ncbi:hypothetical protein KUH32_04345 [Thalassococcus sp. CAU 1522]|uniref:Uncharacterized protein n=1 Tax=Thalassococcus arenae TaxID=2851652 RepID=A0ABS6N4S8_9RHOB|nr:hypothetical protein [Thalassococcus arenae]MBV2358996.1 hypothetical protein [Thalassococcus arenae]
MQLTPEYAAAALFFMLIVLSTAWRRGRIRRAVRDLPTPMQRLLGPEPLFMPPPDGRLPDALRDYAALHRRTRWVQLVLWTVAFCWIAYVVYHALKGPFA